MHRPRRAHSPQYDYDPRMMGLPESRPPPEFDESYPHQMHMYDPHHVPTPGYMDTHNPNYSADYANPPRVPPAQRMPPRDAYPVSVPTTYKILCVTNINPKIADGPVKDALTSDFSRFGDISVSVCHDNGERLAYIYFRCHEDARDARQTKSKTLLFDRPIEIEPIYEPPLVHQDSPLPMPSHNGPPQVPTPPSSAYYGRRRSMTPPEFYGMEGGPMHSPPRRHPPPAPIPGPPTHTQVIPSHNRGISPSPEYQGAARYQSGPSSPLGPAPISYGRYYMQSFNPPTQSPYSSSPPLEPYRSYTQGPLHPHYPHHVYPGPPYAPPMIREREKPLPESHLMTRSPRSEIFYSSDQRSHLPPTSHYSASRSSGHHPSMSPNYYHQSSSKRRSPPAPEVARYPSRSEMKRQKRQENHSGELDDGRPSRVLFVTNIDSSKNEDDLREIFSPFGVIESIEIRKVSSSMSSSLIRFSSMDCAYKAKTALNGRYIGTSRCRMSYGKVEVSRRLWIGGLSPSTTMTSLEDAFAKFGNIVNLDYTSGRPYAYVEYESPCQAQFATQHLRGTIVAGAEKRIRIEYVETAEKVEKPSKRDSHSTLINNLRARASGDQNNISRREASKRSATPPEIDQKRAAQPQREDLKQRTFSSSIDSAPPPSVPSDERNPSSIQNDLLLSGRPGIDDNIGSRSDRLYGDEKFINSRSVIDIISSCPVFWLGQLVLRNFNFPSKFFMCSGHKATIERYLMRTVNNSKHDSEGHEPVLNITQRWRLHPQPKLEEVKRRMQSGNLGMLIITSRSVQAPPCSEQPRPQGDNTQDPATIQRSTNTKEANLSTDDGCGESKIATTETGGSATQSRPLKNLITYLEQKDAAGVISLEPPDRDPQSTEGSKLLYAFPPGDFSLNLLQIQAPNLTSDITTEEFLLGVIVGGAEAKI